LRAPEYPVPDPPRRRAIGAPPARARPGLPIIAWSPSYWTTCGATGKNSA